MSGFDARSMLGYYCFRADATEDALRIWARIPRANLEKRPEIAEMLAEVRHRAALAADGVLIPGDGLPTTGGTDPIGDRPVVTLDTSIGSGPLPTLDPNATVWRAQMPPLPRNGPAQDATEELPGEATTYGPVRSKAPLWTAEAWTADRAQEAGDPGDNGGPSQGDEADALTLSIPETERARENEPATEVSGARNQQPYTQG
jgi:hypothetical protein